LKFKFGSIIDIDNIKPFNKKYKYYDNEKNLLCPLCGYKYKIIDVHKLIAENI